MDLDDFSVDPGDGLGWFYVFARHKIGTLNQISPIEFLSFQPTERDFASARRHGDRTDRTVQKPWGGTTYPLVN